MTPQPQAASDNPATAEGENITTPPLAGVQAAPRRLAGPGRSTADADSAVRPRLLSPASSLMVQVLRAESPPVPAPIVPPCTAETSRT
ncbi:hypothetical protein P3T36_003322 [Kitasatospora sp. MAP12-15]|uniref:hypothetical protein n=1 Tax=unclassified Kitasatospora TaxID=2633591 RepID=UPI00247571E9|nr:hypothetical protein [Kitasatospora sp. MAP12-44]MDH6111298.1 hypothetical protein [Kitasatospora sp. MAP12-44]